MDDLIFRYLHFLGIIVLSASLFTEHLLLKSELAPAELKRIAIVDMIYGLSALTVLAAGLILWFWVGKPAEFYSRNPVFMIKLTLFVIMALISIYPTVFFIKHRKATTNVFLPSIIIVLIRIEMLILVILPLLAVLMARGIGLS